MLTRVDKMLAALIVSGGIPILTYLTGFMVSPDLQAAAVFVLTTFFVWLVPNRPATP